MAHFELKRGSREVSFKAFSLTDEDYDEQYPSQPSPPRRDSIAPEGRSGAPRDRSNTNSVETAIHVPTTTSCEGVVKDDRSHDFFDRCDSRRDTVIYSNTTAAYQTKSNDRNPGLGPFEMEVNDSAAAPADIRKPPISFPHRITPPSANNGNAHQVGRPTPTLRERSPSRDDASVPSTASPYMMDHSAYEPGSRSSAGSIASQETAATSISTLPPLQSRGPDNGEIFHLEPVLEDDPSSWDLVAPAQDEDEVGLYMLEKRAELLFSAKHLKAIFADPKLLLKFTGYLNSHRPKSVPLLIYYLDAVKALRAISYANAIAESLEAINGHGFTEQSSKPTTNTTLEEKANRAFDVLVQEDLPAFVAHVWIQLVSTSVQRRITGTLAPHLREASEGLAEVFCLTDPSRPDNPIIFASEEFTRTTQYGMNYIVGRNCRFLQGPKTDHNSVRRLAMAVKEGKEQTEVFVNYRRDGSPFINLLMIAPLMDSRGNIRYNIGAQVDVSGLLRDCSGLDALTRLVEEGQDPQGAAEEKSARHKDEFQELSEMFNGAELQTVRKYGGRMHEDHVDDGDRESERGARPRLLLKDPSQDSIDDERRSIAESLPLSATQGRLNGKLEGVYQNYLLLRPAPSLRILFTSPNLRVPGILQSPFIDRIGGSSRVRANLVEALADGRGVTAKIRWLTRPDPNGEGDGRLRWIHCTPLVGHTGAVGVWMVVLVDEERDPPSAGGPSTRRYRQAPPVSTNIGGKEWDGGAALRERRQNNNVYDPDQERTQATSRAGHYSMKSPAAALPLHSGSAGRSATHAASLRNIQSQEQPRTRESVAPSNASEFSFNLK